MAKTGKPVSKFPALISYILVVAALIAGLILPLSSATLSSGITFDGMPLMQLGGALSAFGIDLSFGTALTPAYFYEVTLFGSTVNLGAALLLGYAFVTVLAVILLIPACVAKKRRRTCLRIATVAELLALTVLFVMAATLVINYYQTSGLLNYSILLPLGVTLLALMFQCAVYRGASVIVKTLLVILSAAAVFFTVYNVSALVPQLEKFIESAAGALKGSRPFETSVGLYSVGENVYLGSMAVRALFAGQLFAGDDLAIIILNTLTLAVVALLFVNLYFDMLGLGKRTNKAMLTCNLIRYTAQLVLIIALAITVFTAMGSFGLMLYAILALTILQLVIQIIRRAGYRNTAINVIEDEDEEDEDADIADSDDEYAFGSAAPSYTAPALADSTPVVETRNVVYNVNTIYNGPLDNFIKKLNNEQKVEFAKVFLERQVGNLSAIPDYVVGGENSQFFSSVFIYFARVRNIVSDGLMNKLYEEVNLI